MDKILSDTVTFLMLNDFKKPKISNSNTLFSGWRLVSALAGKTVRHVPLSVGENNKHVFTN